MKAPPNFTLPILHDIELTTLKLNQEFPKQLLGKDIEWCYEKLKNYFKQVALGKSVEEPLSNSEAKQAFLDELLNTLEAREEEEFDAHLINNPNYTLDGFAITNIEKLYARLFNRLEKSARTWRKHSGVNGYINFLKETLNLD